MARFVFTLQPLLEARRRDENVKRTAFMETQREREDCLRELERLAGALEACATELHAAACGGVVGQVHVYDQRLRSLECRAGAQRERMAAATVEVERAAGELTEANRERRVVEKLRERRLREHEREEARRDEMEIDEGNALRGVALRPFDKLRAG